MLLVNGDVAFVTSLKGPGRFVADCSVHPVGQVSIRLFPCLVKATLAEITLPGTISPVLRIFAEKRFDEVLNWIWFSWPAVNPDWSVPNFNCSAPPPEGFPFQLEIVSVA